MTVAQGQDTPTPKVMAIRSLTAAGYTLIPLYRGKNPNRKGWTQTPYGKHGPDELASMNYGVLLKPGDLVVDIDPRNFKTDDNPVERLTKKIGTQLHSFAVATGNDGYHIYLRKPADLLVRNAIKESNN